MVAADVVAHHLLPVDGNKVSLVVGDEPVGHDASRELEVPAVAHLCCRACLVPDAYLVDGGIGVCVVV